MEGLEIHRPSTCCRAIIIARLRSGTARNTRAFDVVPGGRSTWLETTQHVWGQRAGFGPKFAMFAQKKKNMPEIRVDSCVVRNSLGLLEPFRASDSGQASSAGPGFLDQTWFRTDLFPATQNGPTAEPNPSHTCLSACHGYGARLVTGGAAMEPASQSRRGEHLPTSAVPAKGKLRRLAAKESAAANERADHRCVCPRTLAAREQAKPFLAQVLARRRMKLAASEFQRPPTSKARVTRRARAALG